MHGDWAIPAQFLTRREVTLRAVDLMRIHQSTWSEPEWLRPRCVCMVILGCVDNSWRPEVTVTDQGRFVSQRTRGQ